MKSSAMGRDGQESEKEVIKNSCKPKVLSFEAEIKVLGRIKHKY
jgi:hypothetical protein